MDEMTLTQGTRYDTSALEHVGWTGGDGEGYDCWVYFADDGTYLGPDQHGAEPTWTWAADAVARGEHPGGRCPHCGTEAEWRTCSECGRSAWIVDCGCLAQPRPIAAGRADGTDTEHWYCDQCAAKEADND